MSVYSTSGCGKLDREVRVIQGVDHAPGCPKDVELEGDDLINRDRRPLPFTCTLPVGT